MRHRIAFVPLLGVALLTLVALAHASPADETWQPGIYDDADFDDVITLIISMSGTPPAAAADALRYGPVAGAVVLPAESGQLPTRLLLPDAARSPPSS